MPLCKRCSMCKVVKQLSAYATRKPLKGLFRSYCRPCQRLRSRLHYLQHRSAYYQRRKTSGSRYIARNKKRIAQLLARSACVDCGINDRIVLDFDHVRGRKLACVSVLVGCGSSWAKIVREISKCKIRCANCHRRRTLETARWVRNSQALECQHSSQRLGREIRKRSSQSIEAISPASRGEVDGALKHCPRCNMAEPFTEFRLRTRGGTRKASYCRPCERLYNREYYRVVDAPKQLLRVAKNDVLYRGRSKLLVLEYLSSHPCLDCGERDPHVLEFDHVTGSKSAAVSKLKNSNTRWAKVFVEIAKCEVRCANCHRRRTFKQFNYTR
jgi:hypothetical protein